MITRAPDLIGLRPSARGMGRACPGELHQPNTLLHADDDVNPSLGPSWLIWIPNDRATVTVCSNPVRSDLSAAVICRRALTAA
jgi:hypothetical protein